MKKILSMMALAAMTACVLVSCGSDDDDSPKGTSSTSKPKTFTIKNNNMKVSFKMMPVKAGAFFMGAAAEQEATLDDEKPAHLVFLTEDYYMGETEVTQELWYAVMGSNPGLFTGENLPVENVSWNDCRQFIMELNNLTGEQFRLPSEAEWEYAARGGNKGMDYVFSGSNTVDEVAWHNVNSGGKTQPVKTKAPNELGIYDMSGNVWEWCQDWYGNYPNKPISNPFGPISGTDRVFRGGSCYNPAWLSRSTMRLYSNPDFRSMILGLRLVL